MAFVTSISSRAPLGEGKLVLKRGSLKIFAPRLPKFPPGEHYQYLVLRDLVSRLEADVRSITGNINFQDIDERILLGYMDLRCNPPCPQSPTAEIAQPPTTGRFTQRPFTFLATSFSLESMG
jgi:hypothetical protein